MERQVEKKAKQWLEASNLDEDSRRTINLLLEPKNLEELDEAFYKDLEFGTGGLRGIMGVGSNRINKYTIGKATQGLSNYLNKTFPGENISVAVAHDSRNNSKLFASICADVFSANNIKVYLFEDLRPTPELSFTVRHFGCKSGVVLTASHNPKEYNGYKAYWEDGAQVTPPHDENIIAEVNAIIKLDDIKFQRKPDLVESIGSEVDEIYLDTLSDLALSPDAVKRQSDMKIVFSPIHGTGAMLVPAILKRLGFNNITLVEEQMSADGNFPTVVYPNPEESEALKLALDKAKEINADLIMATDPDADRVGIAVRNTQNELQLLNGNQTGALLIHYLLSRWSETGKIAGNQYVVKTIVTTDLIASIAKHYQIDCFDTLTGFKYIATMIRELEGKMEFIGGGEESYGYLIGDKVRDKDAVASCAMIAEMAAFYKDNGRSLFEQLMEIYQQFGFYYEDLKSITKKGKRGAEEIQEMMSGFRNSPPTQLGGSQVVELLDYNNLTKKNILTGKTEPLNFPKSNVLQFITEDGSKISARPSGTEPKIKFYFGVKLNEFIIEKPQRNFEEAEKKIKRIQSDLNL